MWSLKLQYESRKGFTLVELILFIGISSMLMLTLFSILTFHIKTSEKILLEDEILLNGRYCIEYIKNEISNADKIIVSHHFQGLDEKYPSNIGFVIAKFRYSMDDKKEMKTSYNYSTYYFQKNKLIRVATNNFTLSDELPYSKLFKGYNEISEGVLKASTITLQDHNLITFDLSLGENDKEIAKFNTTINLRCPVVY